MKLFNFVWSVEFFRRLMVIAHSLVVSGETKVEVEVFEVIASQCWERLGHGVPLVLVTAKFWKVFGKLNRECRGLL